MARKMTAWKTKGMNRDLSVSAFNPEFSFENRNLRLATNEGNTLMSWVNEKGTSQITLVKEDRITETSLAGVPVGTAILNEWLVIFTHDKTSGVEKPDYIYKLRYATNSESAVMIVTLLYNGNLGLGTLYPLETMTSYEAENVQKVYWTDNKNQPRIINIASDGILDEDDNQFDFVPTLSLEETIYVQKILGASGTFAPGVIQYAFTYYNKYGQESNIFYTTPLNYISYKDRGASPEDKVDNAFRITVENPDATHFDYLRIYSIQRTSINGTPICKRIQDIALDNVEGNKVSYIDTGMSGESIDPTELLYKGGEPVTVKSMDQKDGTLFMGNIEVSKRKPDLPNGILASISQERRFFLPQDVSSEGYKYANQLSSRNQDGKIGLPSEASVPCAGFKSGEYYRLGVQFQDKYGRWTEPSLLKTGETVVYETQCKKVPEIINNIVYVPIFKGTLLNTDHQISDLISEGYIRARGVVVFPGIQDRDILCQGVVCPTLYTDNHRGYENDTKGDKDFYAQSSWFFRPHVSTSQTPSDDDYVHISVGTVAPTDTGTLLYTDNHIKYDDGGKEKYFPDDMEEGSEHYYKPERNIKRVEVEGSYNDENKFKVDMNFLTMHSPDLEFDTQLSTVDYPDVEAMQVGKTVFEKTLSDIYIQTETPASSSNGSGFLHKSFVDDGVYGIMSGPFYDDYFLDDNDKIEPYKYQKNSMKWLVYPWNCTGSLNNDINRPANKGTATAILKKKVISNLRYSGNTSYRTENGKRAPYAESNSDISPELFNSDQASVAKVNGKIYQGNVDTLLTPDNFEGKYFAPPSSGLTIFGKPADFNSEVWGKTFGTPANSNNSQGEIERGIWMYVTDHINTPPQYDIWENIIGEPGDEYLDLILKKNPVRMKYKSTPHLVFSYDKTWDKEEDRLLPVFEVRNKNVSQRFGGTSPDALRENVWIPCGEPVMLDETRTEVYFSYGDTYYQRWDCLKTYPFTPEDENQIVEIGSFILETRVNIDGRYDRNRGQQSNINMSPRNFNLLNPVYSQINNFFSYKMLDEDSYRNNRFPNQVTWSKTKQPGADVDMWTNVTMASVLELDGDKGEINKITRFNDQLLCFQDTGLSQLLYNENVIISAQDGVPIEISNSEKVRGKKYISDSVGCSNKWSVLNTPSGVYFMDSFNKAVFMFNGQINNLSGSLGFNAWAKQNIPSSDKKWTPDSFDNYVSYYDKLNQDVLFINEDEALAYSEKIGTFTSFYDYGDTPYFCNLESTGVWVRQDGTLWKHHGAGSAYCKFFGNNYPYYMTLVGNPEPQMDKIFTNIEFRASVDGDGEYSGNTGKFTPALPFDSLESWNEYQHGIAVLQNKNGHAAMKHHTNDSTASLKRRFRIWRCDIPRDNAILALDEGLNISRVKPHPNDRMRNPWVYLKFMKKAAAEDKSLDRTEIHDMVMTYFE